MVTQTSIAPLTNETFWINYSNLLLSTWSVPAVRENLLNAPAQVLAYFDLATVPGGQFEIHEEVNPDEPSFQDQYDLFISGHKSGKYVIYVPPQHPGITARGGNDLTLAAADTSDCCCCTCCPCCSCF